MLQDLDVVDARISKKSVVEKIRPDVEAFLAPYDIAKSRLHFPVDKAGRAINSKAAELNADLLVVGGGVHKVKNWIGLGSTAEKILSKAHRDILVVKA